MAAIKLLALDADDLAVISAHCQDAIVFGGDVTYQQRQKRFVLMAGRLDRVTERPGRGEPYERRRTGLRIGRVQRVQTSGFDPAASMAMVLLAMTFDAVDDPSGIVTLHFAAGISMRLHVEAIEVEMADLGEAWGTKVRPDHGLQDETSVPLAASQPTPSAPEH